MHEIVKLALSSKAEIGSVEKQFKRNGLIEWNSWHLH